SEPNYPVLVLGYTGNGIGTQTALGVLFIIVYKMLGPISKKVHALVPTSGPNILPAVYKYGQNIIACQSRIDSLAFGVDVYILPVAGLHIQNIYASPVHSHPKSFFAILHNGGYGTFLKGIGNIENT